MIYCLTGKIIKKTLDSVVISCGGVGYFVQIPPPPARLCPRRPKEGTVYTIMNVTENDVSLYGFATEEQRDCFKMLTAVTGVGPKAGLAILSIMTPEKIALAASSGDHKAFTKAAGVGPKLAPAHHAGAEGQGRQGSGCRHRLCGRQRCPRAHLPHRRRPWPHWSALGTPPPMQPLPWPGWTRPSRCRRSSRLRCAACRAFKGKGSARA